MEGILLDHLLGQAKEMNKTPPKLQTSVTFLKANGARTHPVRRGAFGYMVVRGDTVPRYTVNSEVVNSEVSNDQVAQTMKKVNQTFALPWQGRTFLLFTF